MNTAASPVITVTLNPAIDETIFLDALHPGQVHRARTAQFDAGGKGVMVAGCLADWGQAVTATGLLGEGNDAVFRAMFAAKGITDAFSRYPGLTRTNIKLVDPHETTDINLPGAEAPAALLQALEHKVLHRADATSLVVLAGSLPAGFAADTYAALIDGLSARGMRTVLDTSGAPLREALAAEARPTLIKPNRAELEAWADKPLPEAADIVATARSLLGRGLEQVVVSMGADGALFITAGAALHASLPAIRPASTVGAGDAMVAGIVAALAEAAAPDRMARLGAAFAYSKLGQIGPNLGTRSRVEALAAQVRVQALG